MIRFMADTWQEAVLRPIAMAAPNTWVYSEIMAPDFRFVLALVLAAVSLILALRSRLDPVASAGQRPTLALLLLVFVSFFPWMGTTGNGRYFMPYLLLIGPLCIGLVNILSITRSMKASLALLLLGVQGFAFFQNNPWRANDSWQSIAWKDYPYFSMEIDEKVLDKDSVYISVGNNSFSLVAPLFPASSQWVNLSIFSGADVNKSIPIYEPVRRRLLTAKSLKLFQRSAPREMLPGTNQPNSNAIAAINSYLRPHLLALKEPTDCILLTSRTLGIHTHTLADDSRTEKDRIVKNAGFWVCSLTYPASFTEDEKFDPARLVAKNALERMESLCPRHFPPGQELVGPHPAGFTRAYASSDSALIITRDGHIYFKYARTLNPQLIAMVDDVIRPEYKFDCDKFKGRGGLPWEREI